MELKSVSAYTFAGSTLDLPVYPHGSLSLSVVWSPWQPCLMGTDKHEWFLLSFQNHNYYAETKERHSWCPRYTYLPTSHQGIEISQSASHNPTLTLRHLLPRDTQLYCNIQLCQYCQFLSGATTKQLADSAPSSVKQHLGWTILLGTAIVSLVSLTWQHLRELWGLVSWARLTTGRD